jgi:alkylated DNA repair protein alkB family protein 6
LADIVFASYSASLVSIVLPSSGRLSDKNVIAHFLIQPSTTFHGQTQLTTYNMAADNALERFRIPDIPGSMFYVPDFIDHREEADLLNAIPSNRWIQLQHRRLQTHPSSLSKSNALLGAPLPSWLVDPIISKFKSLGLFGDSPHHAPNHVLINEYNTNEGIMPHEDGAAYYPIVATVSLSSTLCFDIYEKTQDEEESRVKPTSKWRVLQEPRSLLVTCGSAYTDTLHGISEVEVDEDLRPDTVANWSLLGDSKIFVDNGGKNVRTTRISLTYRDVLKVSKVGARLLGRPRG